MKSSFRFGLHWGGGTCAQCMHSRCLTALAIPVQARSYRARSVRDPRGVLKEFGTTVPEGVSIQICDSNADTR